MRVFHKPPGSTYRVTVTTAEVVAFAATWPCSALRHKPVTFEFSATTGDMVDSDDARQHPGADGSALLALADDAMIYGAKRAGLRGVLELRDRGMPA